MSDVTRPVGELTYAEALAELESLTATLERSEPDIDLLSTQVARAAELLDRCRARLTDTRVDVERILASLEPADPDGPAEPTSPDGVGS